MKSHKYLIGLLVTLLVAAVLMVVNAGSSQAHTGNISVSSAVCVDADSMQATYNPVWQNGTASGTLYSKLGLVGDAGTYSEVGPITGAAGTASFTLTHAKSEFNGGNGPWVSFKIIFSDNFVVTGDTRVENFDWSKCQPVIPEKPQDLVVVTYGNWTGGAVSCLEPTATETRTVTQTTTPYVYDKPSNTWVEGTPVVVQLPDETKEVTWVGDLNDCRVKPDQPKDLVVVTYGEWTGGEVSCLAPDATETRTATQTTTPFIFNKESWTWVEGTPVVVQLPDETKAITWVGNPQDCAPVVVKPKPPVKPVPPVVKPKPTTVTPVPTVIVHRVELSPSPTPLASTGVESGSLLAGGVGLLLAGVSMLLLLGRRSNKRH